MSSLSHHGIKGQKWGVRRYQNKDGTRTALGRRRQADAQNVYKNQAVDMLREFKKNVKAKGVYGYEKTENEFLKHIENIALVERHNAYVDVLNNENEEFAREALKNYYDLSEVHSEMNKMITDRRKTVHSKALDDDNNLLKSNIDSFYKEMTDDQRRKIDDLEELTSLQTMEKKEAPSKKATHTSIGGTIYIEGNALILGDSSYLEHHGIKGQRWGVRRYQNKDGTRTAAGKKQEKQNRLKATSKDYASIRESLSDNDLKMLNYSNDEIKYMRKHNTLGHDHIQYGKTAHRVIQKDKNGTPVTYVDATWFKAESLLTGKKAASIISIDLATRAGDEYRGKGHAIAAGKKMVKWFDTYGYKDYEYMEWAAKEENVSSQKTAEKLGFKKLDVHDEGWTLYAYEHKAKHTAIGGTMYIEGNALILGDSSYLEHHGIRGQRWGVRRFQNRDGSLTNAGRKRLGYATKGAVQTVGKAFKAGVKAGGNAVKAAKAHHEKKEAEKLEKKKEKASKTRIGVMANKDLFTDAELKKLNDRFKLEDEMKMATLEKGVEIAKSIGTIAQNVGYVAKAYEDVTGTSLSPIKRKAAEEKARQDKEDRERKIAREDAEEARKAAKEERDIAIHEQTLRKAIASADTQEFTAQKTKAEADSSILDLYKKGQDVNGGTDATGQSWVEKAKNGGKNPFDDMIANRDPEYAQIRKEHDEKVARKERMEYLERREKEREAEKAAAASRQSAPQQKQGGNDALFSQKGSLPLDKDRYRNNRAMEKAKQVKEDAADERAKKQDEKAAKATIDDMMEARRQFTDSARANSNGAFDRETAANYIKGKAKELPNKLNPVNAIAKKITNKALKEEEDNARKAMEDEYKKASRSQGRDEANYTMYYNRVNALQAQGYSERQAKKVADTESPFSSKRNRRFEYNEKVGEIETTHRKNSKEINKANKELTDYYYKLVNGPGYEPGSPKREELDRKYAQKRGELERLEKDNNDMLDREKKKAKKILEHSLTIQNGVLFVDYSDGLTHHGIKGQRWGVRRFQNPDGTLTAAGKKRDARQITKELNKNDKALAWEYRHIGDRTEDYERWDKKAKKAEDKGKLDKAEKFKQKRDENSAKLEEHRKNAKSMNEKTVSLISEAVKKGYDVKTKDTKRSVNTGGEIAANIALNVLAAAAGSPVLMTRRKYIEGTKYKVKAKHDAFTIQNGTLFINAGEPYLEHHGVKGMKWGKHLMAGKGEAGAGGGSGEDDEKLKEMAKKAGMSVAEFRTKMAGKLSGAASKVGSSTNAGTRSGYRILSEDVSGAARPKAERKKITRKDVGEALYNIAGGNAKKAAQEHHRNMVNYKNEADKYSRNANTEGSAAKAHKRAGNVSAYIGAKTGARVDEENAKNYRLAQYSEAEEANKAQRKYDRSLAGLYDKATGKYKQVHKQTTTPSLSKQYQYYMKDVNGKLFNHGNGKGSAKDQAKQSVWNAADNRILADDARAKKNDYYEDDGYGTAYRKAADKVTERYGRAAEASYRRAAALGKQASSESSTSSRPRARKKKHTSGGSGVTVRRPGRKPVSRTKRVTQSSTGVKRRGSTGSGRTVRRGA